MSRKSRGNGPSFRPVLRAELPEKHIRWRVVAMVVTIAIAIGAFGYGIASLMQSETGWQKIEARSDAETLFGNELVFMYNIGASGENASVETKQLMQLYTEAGDEAFHLFSDDAERQSNLAYLNAHPNVAVEVEPALYDALQKAESSRLLYLAPMLAQYDNVFMAEYDEQAEEIDPLKQSDLRSLLKEIAAFAQDPSQISIKFESGNRVTLVVSDAYVAFARENELETLTSFSLLQNAFVVDYIADRLTQQGFTLGTISSFDGFCRSLDNSGTSYSFNVYDRLDAKTTQNVGLLNVKQAVSLVYFRDFQMNALDQMHYYVYEDGTTRFPYLDMSDGVCKSAVPGLIGYSDKQGCADLAVALWPLYTASTLDKARISELTADSVYTVWCENRQICYTGTIADFSGLYQKDDVRYELHPMQS